MRWHEEICASNGDAVPLEAGGPLLCLPACLSVSPEREDPTAIRAVGVVVLWDLVFVLVLVCGTTGGRTVRIESDRSCFPWRLFGIPKRTDAVRRGGYDRARVGQPAYHSSIRGHSRASGMCVDLWASSGYVRVHRLIRPP